MKKIYFALLTFFSFSMASADDLCCFDNCMYFTPYGEYLYLQPGGSNLYYGAEAFPIDESLTVPSASPSWKSLEIDPNYHSAFRVGVATTFNNMVLDLNWEYYRGKDSSNVSAEGDNFVGPYFDIGPNSGSYKVAHGKMTSQFNQVNLTLGTRYSFCDSFITNIYGGVAYNFLKQTKYASYFNEKGGDTGRTVNSSSRFSGAGPQIGVKYDYNLWDGLYLSGNSAFSIFIGEMKNSTNFRSFTPELVDIGNTNPNIQSITVPNRTQVVPAFEQKLGFTYYACFDCFTVSLGVGYQWQVYLNAVQTVDVSGQAVPNPFFDVPQVGVFASGFHKTLSNFTLSGPYVNLAVEF